MVKTNHCFWLITYIVLAAARKRCSSLLCRSNSSQLITGSTNFTANLKPIPLVEFIRRKGYPVEEHEIQTEDGYLLTYHRIPHGKIQPGAARRPPVLLQHGMLVCSSVWITTDSGLGFLLADAGFDVWLGNTRGNTYSRKHVKYDPVRDNEDFWNFSWHEVGLYDLPAAIDYILRNTSHDQLSYLGHSQGTTSYFVMGSKRPEYMGKVNAMVAFAPVAYMWNFRSPVVKFLLHTKKMLYWLVEKLDVHGIFLHTDEINWAAHMCTSGWLRSVCYNFVAEITGFDPPQFDWSNVPIQLDYNPAGSSIKMIKHYLQVAENGFNEYDYGPKMNILKYGTPAPPAYNLSSVKSPVYVWWATNDYLVIPQTVELTLAHLPNVKQTKKVPDDHFNHVDFIWALNAKTLLYDAVIAMLKRLK